MEDPSCLALTEPSPACVYAFHCIVSLQMLWFAWEVSLLGDTLLFRGLLRTQCGVGTGSKNQSHLTEIGRLVTQTLRQLTHTVPCFKHEEIDAVFTAGSCQDSSLESLLSWWMSGEEQCSGEHANGFLGEAATGSMFASAGTHWGLGWDPSVCWRHGVSWWGAESVCRKTPQLVHRGPAFVQFV